jgi:hypothetical protein
MTWSKRDWTRKPEILRETIQTNLKEMCHECSEWGGLCDVCCIRLDYNNVLRTLIELLPSPSPMRDADGKPVPITCSHCDHEL